MGGRAPRSVRSLVASFLRHFSGFGCRLDAVGFRVSACGVRVSGLAFRVSGVGVDASSSVRCRLIAYVRALFVSIDARCDSRLGA